MEALSERLEVRIDRQAGRRLREAARRRGVSVGQVVREAIERWVEDDASARLHAAEALCRIEAPVTNWPTMEQEIVAAHRAEPT